MYKRQILGCGFDPGVTAIFTAYAAKHHFDEPMDINANYSEEDNPIALKADFILSLCELIVGGKEGLQPVEKTVIDRCAVSYTHLDHAK